MDIIIFLAAIFVPPAALIWFLINLVKYIAARKKQENVKKRMWIIPMAVIFISYIVEIAYNLSLGVNDTLQLIIEMLYVTGAFTLMLLPPYSLIAYFALSLRSFIKAVKTKSRKTIHIVNLAVSSCMIASAVILLVVFGGNMFHM